jgi:predicted lipid-binding transport protein (Tim44 family)
MKLEPPSGSGISVTTDGAHPLIVVPHGSGGLMRYLVGLFLLAWLGGWFAGLRSAVSMLSSGGAPGGVQAFLAFWLVGWTLGGAMAMYWAYRSFRPSVPESLRLMPNGVTYDSGIPPLQTYSGNRSPKDGQLSP